MTASARPVINVSLEEMASAMGVSERRVQQLADQFVVKPAGGGKYELFSSLTGYVRYLQDAMGKKSTMDTEGNVTNTKHQRAQLLDIEVATATINLARAREQVMAIDDHKMIMSHSIMETKARVMTIGARAAPKVLNLKSRSEIKKVIDQEAIDALIAMSKFELPMPAEIIAKDPPAEQKAKAPRARAKNAAKKSRKKKTSRSSKSTTS